VDEDRGGGGGGGDHRKGEFDAAALTRCAWSPLVCQSIAGVRRVPSRLVAVKPSSLSFSRRPTTYRYLYSKLYILYIYKRAGRITRDTTTAFRSDFQPVGIAVIVFGRHIFFTLSFLPPKNTYNKPL